MSCSIDGCTNHAKARGWCGMHYARWQRHGDAHHVERIVGDPELLFWSQVEKTDDCWLWTGELTRDGYGRFTTGNQRVPAHRWSYERFVGPIPDGLQLDHVKARGCSHRRCVRPDHLEPVTCRENLLRGDTVNAANAAKTECVNGHPFDTTNTYVAPSTGERGCRTCRAEARRRHRERSAA